MSTIYQLRDDETDELLGLYTFESDTMTEFYIKEEYHKFKTSEEYENEDNMTFDYWLESKHIGFQRLFTEEIYV
jgi:hypothetical protein